MTRIWALIPLIVAAGCGGGDSTPSAADKACSDLTAKAKQCGAQAQCDSTQVCQMSCAAKATCSQLTATPAGSYLTCVAACAGLGPDPFVCADGTAFLARAGVCNGRFECPDGSDEKNCSDAGKP